MQNLALGFLYVALDCKTDWGVRGPSESDGGEGGARGGGIKATLL